MIKRVKYWCSASTLYVQLCIKVVMIRNLKCSMENRTGYPVTNCITSVNEGARYTMIHIRQNTDTQKTAIYGNPFPLEMPDKTDFTVFLTSVPCKGD